MPRRPDSNRANRRIGLRLALLIVAAPALIAVGCGSDDGSTTAAEETTGASTDSADAAADGSLTLTSTAFSDGDELEVKYTCDGEGISPPLDYGGVPADAAELVLVVSDPDAPGGTFVHATAFGIDPADTVAPEGRPPTGSVIGGNDGDGGGYFPPCPPEGDGAHRYEFTAYALGEASGLEEGAAPADVISAAESAAIGTTTLTATYER